MNDKPEISAPAIDNPTASAKDHHVAKLIVGFAKADTLTNQARFGKNGEALLAELFDPTGIYLLDAALHACTDPFGRITGWRFGNHLVDYTPNGNGEIGDCAFQPDSAATHRVHGTLAAEGSLFNRIATADLPVGVMNAIAAIDPGYKDAKLPRKMAHAIAKALVIVSLNHAINGTPAMAGVLHTLRRYRASLRHGISRHLWNAETTGEARALNDLLISCPLLALLPQRIRGFVGKRLKDTLRDIGLPPSVRKLQPLPLSPIAHYLRTTERVLSGADLQWLTEKLMGVMPEDTDHQYRATLLGMKLALAGTTPHEIEARLLWLCKNIAEIAKDVAVSNDMHEWLTADDEVLQRVGIPAWHPEISATTALDATKRTLAIHEIIKDPERSKPFKLPDWVSKVIGPIKGSRWSLNVIVDEIGLIAAGQRLHNCAATYAGRCRTGRTVIAELRRAIPTKPTRSKSKLPTDSGEEIGGMIEIVDYAGRWQLAQAKGPFNSAPRASILAAADLVINAINSIQK